MVTIYVSREAKDKKPEKKESQVEADIAVGADEKFKDDELTPIIQRFLAKFETKLEDRKQLIDTPIKVSEVLGKLAHLYEKIRTTIEYKGEHVLRRNAIERILKRLVWESEGNKSNIGADKIAETLLRELIWARYLPNNAVPRSKSKEVAAVIEKYLYLLNNVKKLPHNASVASTRSWIWGVASSEIEDFIDPSYRELYIQLMFDWFKSYFTWVDNQIPEHERDIQVYLAIHRALAKSDEPIMRFHLLLQEFPNFRDTNRKELEVFVERFPFIYNEIEGHINYPGRLSIFRRVQRHAGAFEIFKVVAQEEKGNLRNLLKNEKLFEDKIRAVCNERYKAIKRKVNTGIIRSIIYIFISKMVLALLIEVPYEIYRFNDIRYIPLAINIILPILFMWLIGTAIKIPGEKNTMAIMGRIKSFVYSDEELPKHLFSIRTVGTRSSLVKIFGAFYLLSFGLIFGLVTYILLQLNFTFLGIFIFFMFLSLVLLFSLRVSFNANQLKVESEKESAMGYLFNYLTLPFLNFGYYISKGLSKFNFFSIFLDFLIEAPLKSVIDIFEEWTSFLREKKEEVVELPE